MTAPSPKPQTERQMRKGPGNDQGHKDNGTTYHITNLPCWNRGNVPKVFDMTNISQAARFLRILDPDAEEYNFRTFDDTGGNRGDLARKISGSFQAVSPVLEKLNGQGAGVFAVVNAGGQTKDGIDGVRAVFADTDGAPLEPLLSHLPPHMVVQSSPGNWHVYWLVNEAFPLEGFAPVQSAIAAKFDTDPVVKDLPRVMRLPGFNHCKGEPVLVEITQSADGVPRYSYEDIVSGLKLNIAPAGVKIIGLPDSNLSGGAYVVPDKVPAGKRNAAVMSYLGHLRGTGTPESIISTAVHDFNQARCVPPMDADEVNGLVARYAKPDPDKTEGWPDPKPIDAPLPAVKQFDTGLLPETLRLYVEDQAELMQMSPDYLAAALMVAVAATIGNGIVIAPKANDTTWFVALVLWGGIIGRPGMMKSPAMGKALAPLTLLEAEMAKAFEARQAEFILNKITYDNALAEARKSAKTGQIGQLPPVPEEPQPERLLVNDSTVQKLVELHRWSPRGLLVARDEVVALLETLSSEGQEGARGAYLEGWNGLGSYRVDRVGRGSFIIPRFALWVFGGIQPGKLVPYVRGATHGGRGDDGLLQRFQMLVWPDPPAEWKNVDRQPNFEAMAQVEELFQRMRSLDPVAIGAVVDRLGNRPAYLHFTSEAQELFDAYRAKLETSLRTEGRHPALESHLAKYRSLIPALALLIHLADYGTGPVTKAALHQAIGWGNYLWSHARRVYACVTNSAGFAARSLADRIENGKLENGFSAREVLRHGWQNLGTPDDVRGAIEWLLDAGWLMAQQKPAGTAGGRPAEIFTINPKVRSR